ncbi:hypothetical protein [Cupriavidus sp. UME77]|uniref:hypothetical protein n=1 Tax=Cupriavidus sp. UME77 TaxID=1862321 RepID=UPI001601A654|nr:hypothetical protein [Cupriavidus sp. UME77]MBB1634829.1 hypothetical protein [Cupriavidus sp. UME77]
MNQILATFVISEDVERPKTAGVCNGYAPHHKFVAVDYLASGIHSYEDSNFHFPGEKLKAKISFASWQFFSDKIKVGDEFEVRENARLIGHGRVDEIL